MEGLITSYKSRLDAETNPGLLLSRYYLEIHQLPSSSLAGFLPTINKLIRLYGRQIVFYSITSTADFAEVNHSNIYRLLSYLCKKHLQGGGNETVFLEEVVKTLNKPIKKVKVTEVRSPFDD